MFYYLKEIRFEIEKQKKRRRKKLLKFLIKFMMIMHKFYVSCYTSHPNVCMCVCVCVCDLNCSRGVTLVGHSVTMADRQYLVRDVLEKRYIITTRLVF